MPHVLENPALVTKLPGNLLMLSNELGLEEVTHIIASVLP